MTAAGPVDESERSCGAAAAAAAAAGLGPALCLSWLFCRLDDVAFCGAGQGGANHGLRAYCIAEIVSMGAPASGKKGKKAAAEELTVGASSFPPEFVAGHVASAACQSYPAFAWPAGWICLDNDSRLCS